MLKNKILLVFFLIGLVLMVYSWTQTFPLSLTAIGDSLFNHISILYWVSVPILLVSMFLIAATTKSKYLNLAMAVGIVVTLYSLTYFYYSISTADASFFRGLMENFSKTNDLNASQPIRSYYQWPSFFLLSNIVTSISGLSLAQYEYFLFTVIAFLLSSSMYVYISKVFQKAGFAAVACFFIVMFSFINFQAVPFTLAFALLFVLFMLETDKGNAATTTALIIVYTVLVLTHAFVALFFIIYLLIHSIVARKRRFFELFCLSLVIYLTAQITLAVFSFRGMVSSVFTSPSEYSSVAGATFATIPQQADVIPHFFSRYITIVFGFFCVAGFFLVILKKKMRKLDLAIFLTGLVYSGLGVVLSLLGTRAIPLLFVPVVLGVGYLMEFRFKKVASFVLAVLIIFVVFVPMHYSFLSFPIAYQTRDDLATANFMLDRYNWSSQTTVLCSSYNGWYMLPQIYGRTQLVTSGELIYPLSEINSYQSIIFSVGLLEQLNMSNIPANRTFEQLANYDIVYNSGYSYIESKVG